MVGHIIVYFHMRNIASIRLCLTQKAAVRLIYSLIISRIDYANCLLHDIPDCLINKLQRVHNAAARLVVRCHRWDHITPVLKKLHWLPVKQRIHYAIVILAFRAQHGLAPAYITNLLHEQRATRVLRSATNNDLYVPPSRSRYGDRTFSVSAPRMWNALPNEMKTISCLVTFKRLLKTHLFRVAYAS